jgi:hypothetical protein
VLAGERDQLGQPQHHAVLARDLDDRTGRAQIREPGEVDGRLGVAVAHQHTTGLGAEREDMAGTYEVGRSGLAAREELEGGGAVGRGDTGGHAVGGARVDGDGEGGPHRLGVVLDHLREFEPVQFLALHGDADQAAALAHHEGDDLGGGLFGGDDEVALVLAVLVIDDHDGPAGGDVADGVLDGVEGEVLDVVLAVPGGQGSHAAAPSKTCWAARERNHQSRMPHRTSTK